MSVIFRLWFWWFHVTNCALQSTCDSIKGLFIVLPPSKEHLATVWLTETLQPVKALDFVTRDYQNKKRLLLPNKKVQESIWKRSKGLIWVNWGPIFLLTEINCLRSFKTRNVYWKVMILNAPADCLHNWVCFESHLPFWWEGRGARVVTPLWWKG